MTYTYAVEMDKYGRPATLDLGTDVQTGPAKRDKYGRSTTPFYLGTPCAVNRIQAVLVTMPKGYAEKYGKRYLVNVWGAPRNAEGRTPCQEFVKRADAKRWAEEQVQALTA